jgi:hypothetical protein
MAGIPWLELKNPVARHRVRMMAELSDDATGMQNLQAPQHCGGAQLMDLRVPARLLASII